MGGDEIGLSLDAGVSLSDDGHLVLGGEHALLNCDTLVVASLELLNNVVHLLVVAGLQTLITEL